MTEREKILGGALIAVTGAYAATIIKTVKGIKRRKANEARILDLAEGILAKLTEQRES